MSRASSAKLLRMPKSGSAHRPNSQRSSVTSPTNDLTILASAKNLKVRPKTAWKKSDLDRFQVPRRANLTKDEIQQQIEKKEAEIRRLELESQSRKRSLQELDMLRDEQLGKNSDPFAEEKAEQELKLLNQALWAKHEQVICLDLIEKLQYFLQMQMNCVK